MDAAERAGTHHFPRKKPIVRPQRNPLEWRANLTQLSNPDGSAVDGTNVTELTHGELQGASISVDVVARTLDLLVPEAELARRRAELPPLAPPTGCSWLSVYARSVRPFGQGATPGG